MAKMALVTTTIHTPRVLELYRQYTDIPFFVAGDRKTPLEAQAFCNKLSNCIFISADEQSDMAYKTVKQLPWNCIMRRNIAVLEALKWGAEIIISIDDDNIPLHSDYFLQFQLAFTSPFDGLCASSPSDWFDPGELLQLRAPHRGFPTDRAAQPMFEPIVGAKVAVAAGVVLGDPDTSAVFRMANAPVVHNASMLLQTGIVVDPAVTWTVFNTQNTAYTRALAPAMLLCSQLRRYDDIIASLITQRVMAEHGAHVRIGPPFVWQNRNIHNPYRDLGDEMYGMQHIVRIAERLNDFEFFESGPVSLMVRQIYAMLAAHHDWPGDTLNLANAWCDDCEGLGL